MSNFVSILGQIGPKMDISGVFKDPFQPKCTETDLKKSQIYPIWGQSDPIWIRNLPSLMPSVVRM